MASYLDKEQLNTAITNSTKLDLSHAHITTANFMELAPVYSKELVPGEKLSVNLECFSRMNSLPVPTFGRANIKNRAYFVPFRTIFRGWTDFITDAPHANSAGGGSYVGNLLSAVPTVTNATLVGAFTTQSYETGYAPDPTSPQLHQDYGSYIVQDPSVGYDFVHNTGTGVYHRRFTPVGRQLIKVLESLGYKINWNNEDVTPYSALPLLAFAKIYVDWYFPSAYTNVAAYNYILQLCNIDNGTNLVLNKTDVGRILQYVYTCYDSDYFVSAWDNPVSPGPGLATQYTENMIVDITNKNSYRSTVETNPSILQYGTPFMRGNSGSSTPTPYYVTEYALHSLHALSDYMKRHQLAGSRAMDRYLARFGKALPAEKLNRSVYLGCQTVPVQFGDVMSTADTAGALLGEYSGKGLAYGQNGTFEFSTNEYGMFMVVSTITPATGYFQGVDRTVKHISKLDFWTPEFDSLGAQPITADELYVTMDGSNGLAQANASANIHTAIFGFCPRYAEYKIGRDQVTGNFRVPSLNGDVSTNN